MGVKRTIPKQSHKMRGVCLILLVAATAYAAVDEEKSYKPDGGKFLIGVRRTAVITTISTSTATVGATCYQVITTTTCSGKRKRRGLERKLEGISDNIAEDLESSQDSDSASVLDTEGQLQKLVIWTTSTQTVTFTSSSTATGTTLTVAQLLEFLYHQHVVKLLIFFAVQKSLKRSL